MTYFFQWVKIIFHTFVREIRLDQHWSTLYRPSFQQMFKLTILYHFFKSPFPSEYPVKPRKSYIPEHFDSQYVNKCMIILFSHTLPKGLPSFTQVLLKQLIWTQTCSCCVNLALSKMLLHKWQYSRYECYGLSGWLLLPSVCPLKYKILSLIVGKDYTSIPSNLKMFEIKKIWKSWVFKHLHVGQWNSYFWLWNMLQVNIIKRE